MQNALKAVLFDADGVIQHPAVDYPSAFAELVKLNGDNIDRLIGEIFTAEQPALTGRGDFAEELVKVLSSWGLIDRLDDVLKIWTSIQTDAAMFALIGSLRSLGFRCCLATNQQAHRGRYMSETLCYRDMFDFQFYSYRLGAAKPATEYFRAVIKQLDLGPSEVLFIDDHEPNVAAARGVGINASLFTAKPPSSAAALRAILLQHGIQLP